MSDITQQHPPLRLVAAGQGTLGAEVPGLPRFEVKLAAADGLGFSVIEQQIPAGFSPPPHQHRQTREDAAVYVLQGQLHLWFDDQDAIAEAGTLVHLPRMRWWRFANDSDAPCRVLAIFAPAGFEQYFLDLSNAVAASAGDPASTGAAIGRLRAQYGDEEQTA
jgi:quercetin dioxygenase-like cupin family protein